LGVRIVGDERTHDRFLVDRLLFSMREVVPEQLADPEVAKPMIVAVDDAPSGPPRIVSVMPPPASRGHRPSSSFKKRRSFCRIRGERCDRATKATSRDLGVRG
jgi:hypothetical protein